MLAAEKAAVEERQQRNAEELAALGKARDQQQTEQWAAEKAARIRREELAKAAKAEQEAERKARLATALRNRKAKAAKAHARREAEAKAAYRLRIIAVSVCSPYTSSAVSRWIDTTLEEFPCVSSFFLLLFDFRAHVNACMTEDACDFEPSRYAQRAEERERVKQLE
eukprot:COSAG05_NODE_6688_length_920_cov_1.142509_1_plen_166_part_10